MHGLSDSPLERAMKDLVEAQAEMDRCRLRIEKLQFVVDYLTGSESHELSRVGNLATPDATVSHSTRLLSKDSPLFGKSLAEAAIYALGQIGTPSSDVEIAACLSDLGWSFVGNKSAATSIYWALRENALKHKDVLSEPGSKWRLSAWGQDSERAAKSRLSLKVARANGVVLGPRPKITPEMEVRLKKLLDQGTPVAVTARELKISVPTIYRFMKRVTEPVPDLTDVARATLTEQDDTPVDAGN